MCLAHHHLRECRYLNELDKVQQWSRSVESLLQETIHERNQKPTESIDSLSWLDRLDKLIDENLSRLNDKFTTFKKGLLKCRHYIFNFIRNQAIPPDKNASERGIRKLKIKLKNSG
ncbi:IS66 family transposase [Muribaculum intestinale]|uniref:IS66 family transposase n=1 Tax=Muribaculum intestinale TaxID=1796646 RepID=UPI0025B4DFF6|nr:transposase [Muribaculum intestinale]